MISVSGPSIRRPDGTIKEALPPRLIPKRQWENPASRAALVAAGIRPSDEPFIPEGDKRGPGRPSTVQKQLNELQKELEKLREENAALKSNNDPDASKA